MNVIQLTEGDVEKVTTWVFDSGQQINFVTLPLLKTEVVENVKILGFYQ
jgi:hypothetical protein